jgi:hypothetical protein
MLKLADLAIVRKMKEYQPRKPRTSDGPGRRARPAFS